MKDEDPLQELRRIRDAMAKKFHYDAEALGEYLRSVPLLPGQTQTEPEGGAKNSERKKRARPKAGTAIRSAVERQASAFCRKTAPSKKKSPTHA